MPKTKEEIAARKKEYYEKNKERIAAYQKAYNEKNKKKVATRKKDYHEKHKERIAAQKKAYQEKHKERDAKYIKEWSQKNKESINKSQIKYRQSPKGKKVSRINKWKLRGIISDDYTSLYEKFINTKNCEECNVKLTEGRQTTPTTRCLDHDHSITDNPNVRNVLCVSCNVKRG